MNRKLLLVIILMPGLVLATGHRKRSRRLAPVTPVTYLPYENEALHLNIRIPSGWQIRRSDGAIGFSSPFGDPHSHAALGILKSSTPESPIEQAAMQEFNHEGGPAHWHQDPTRIAGQRVIRIATRKKDNPAMRRVEFYIESPHGLYIVQCMAPSHQWRHYDDVFSSMISSLNFLP